MIDIKDIAVQRIMSMSEDELHAELAKNDEPFESVAERGRAICQRAKAEAEMRSFIRAWLKPHAGENRPSPSALGLAIQQVAEQYLRDIAPETSQLTQDDSPTVPDQAARDDEEDCGVVVHCVTETAATRDAIVETLCDDHDDAPIITDPLKPLPRPEPTVLDVKPVARVVQPGQSLADLLRRFAEPPRAEPPPNRPSLMSLSRRSAPAPAKTPEYPTAHPYCLSHPQHPEPRIVGRAIVEVKPSKAPPPAPPRLPTAVARTATTRPPRPVAPPMPTPMARKPTLTADDIPF